MAVDALLVLTGLLLLPSTALAWGPGAHIDFSLQILSGAVALSPVLRSLLRKFSRDFMYGALAADHVVGKNLSSDEEHCHSWLVALKLLEESKKDRARHAFMLGYVGHVAADIVAHNHFVPKLIVSSYPIKGAGHLYWEALFDHGVMARNSKVNDTWMELEGLRFDAHNEFLSDRLVAPVFPHGLSRFLFQKSMLLQRRQPWRRTIHRIASRTLHKLSSAEIELWRKSTLDIVALGLREPDSTLLLSLDPTGKRAIAEANSHRKALRQSHGR
ncbi:MAG: zinc dependent phospholipase C family protein [Myxococcota bacterium]|nr:zinc dependent phospholipase C family protein [Myxococcota bacterium]